jgi:hypothetical protein
MTDKAIALAPLERSMGWGFPVYTKYFLTILNHCLFLQDYLEILAKSIDDIATEMETTITDDSSVDSNQETESETFAESAC